MTTLEGRAAYELWADTYPAIAHNPLMRVEQEIVALLLARLRAERALDVGTGSGRYVPVLQGTGASVVGLDFSLAMLAHGTGRRVCADACRLPVRRGALSPHPHDPDVSSVRLGHPLVRKLDPYDDAVSPSWHDRVFSLDRALTE